MIYLDQAATSFPKPREVAEAVCSTLEKGGSSGRGVHDLSLAASRLVFAARQELADFFGAPSPNTISFTANATESLNLALNGIFKPGDHVITTAWEHNSVLRPLYLLEVAGVELSILPCDSSGRLNLELLEKYLQPNTKAVVCTHASNVTGNLLNLDYVSRFCTLHNLLLIVDGAQTAGAIPLNVQKTNVDVFCFTGHKSLYGPQGIGGIYVRPGLKLRPLKVGGTGVKSFEKMHPAQMPEILEAGTLNMPGIAGLLAGVRYLKKIGLENIYQQEKALTQYFYEQAQKLPGLRLYGEFTNARRCPIIALNIADFNSNLVSRMLAAEYGIYTRSGAQCAPLLHQALQTVEQGVVRFSFSHFNTVEQLEKAIDALKDIQRRMERGGI